MPSQHLFVRDDPDAPGVRHIKQAAGIVARYAGDAIEGLKRTRMDWIAYIQQANRLGNIARAGTSGLVSYRAG